MVNVLRSRRNGLNKTN